VQNSGIKKTEKERFPDFEIVIEENNRQLVEEILPLYKNMVEHFGNNMSLATTVTRKYFGTLVEFVEIWDRWLNKTIPKEAIKWLGHSEDKLKPFYKDLANHMESLSSELDK